MYINLLTQLKNAQAVKKENVKIPYSKMDEGVLKILTSNNYIENFEKKGQKIKRYFDVKLKYVENKGAINGIKLISKPSRRIYVGFEKIRLVKSGYGLMVVSTSKGIMSGQEARKVKMGGLALFEIW
ncbi:30S ribosomal protein S8 [Candidatus Wolfebacteria bacterium CG_4_9_14_3_um_filter_37_9]|uniref:Small ribosomal subunit protein uS8 n=1 Tax=Candidatus Wolfebacteria bacterium CG_4_9_14_3_um_filter_37_9 TaxID=1975065 RepID=A0A2M7X6S2_9BACT|nr:MAG: 30S ribosomal protein S8 [Candidatus Wolfebacteria bacterium CG_4_9_14_3_um_filter_37_9]